MNASLAQLIATLGVTAGGLTYLWAVLTYWPEGESE